MLTTLLAVLVATSPAHAGTACADLHDFALPSDTGMSAEIDWERHTGQALTLLTDGGRPDCAKELSSDLRAALRVANTEGRVNDTIAQDLQQRLGAVHAVAANVVRGWRLVQQGRPDHAQNTAQEALTSIASSGLVAQLTPTQRNRLESQANDLWTLAQDAADARKALSSGDTERAASLAQALWTMVEGWCGEGRLGVPQCVAITAEAASLLGKAEETGASGEVPYLFQRDNLLDPDTSGANTAVAMLLAHYGASVSPDEITRAWGNRFANKPAGLANVFNDQAVKHGVPVRLIPHASGTMAELDRQLAAGVPTIVHGRFAVGGHAVVALRKEGSTYVVNDPGGRWTQHYEGGYGYSGSDEGRATRYDGSAFRKAVATHDGINTGPVSWHEIRRVD